MVEKRQQRKTGTRGRKGASEKTGAKPENGHSDVDLKDLEKAGEHFLMSAAELFVGTGFAIKGVRNLLQDEEGRKFLKELPYNAVTKGFELVKQAEEEYRARKAGKSGTGKSKRSRKITVE